MRKVPPILQLGITLGCAGQFYVTPILNHIELVILCSCVPYLFFASSYASSSFIQFISLPNPNKRVEFILFTLANLLAMHSMWISVPIKKYIYTAVMYIALYVLKWLSVCLMATHIQNISLKNLARCDNNNLWSQRNWLQIKYAEISLYFTVPLSRDGGGLIRFFEAVFIVCITLE